MGYNQLLVVVSTFIKLLYYKKIPVTKHLSFMSHLLQHRMMHLLPESDKRGKTSAKVRAPRLVPINGWGDVMALEA